MTIESLYTQTQIQLLADVWRRRAEADRRDFGNTQANRIELCADEILALVPHATNDVYLRMIERACDALRIGGIEDADDLSDGIEKLVSTLKNSTWDQDRLGYLLRNQNVVLKSYNNEFCIFDVKNGVRLTEYFINPRYAIDEAMKIEASRASP